MVTDPYIKYNFIVESSIKNRMLEDDLIIYKNQNYYSATDYRPHFHLSFNNENDYILWKIKYGI